ncbi:hypothetical protein J6590_042128 [Homalodisca vitripennis]|nr:hypothetical protein J6590_042128 [Homalodisca vitripennis]
MLRYILLGLQTVQLSEDRLDCPESVKYTALKVPMLPLKCSTTTTLKLVALIRMVFHQLSEYRLDCPESVKGTAFKVPMLPLKCSTTTTLKLVALIRMVFHQLQNTGWTVLSP